MPGFTPHPLKGAYAARLKIPGILENTPSIFYGCVEKKRRKALRLYRCNWQYPNPVRGFLCITPGFNRGERECPRIGRPRTNACSPAHARIGRNVEILLAAPSRERVTWGQSCPQYLCLSHPLTCCPLRRVPRFSIAVFIVLCFTAHPLKGAFAAGLKIPGILENTPAIFYGFVEKNRRKALSLYRCNWQYPNPVRGFLCITPGFDRGKGNARGPAVRARTPVALRMSVSDGTHKYCWQRLPVSG